MILKSYLLHVIGANDGDIRIPIGRWGDIGAAPHDLADASVCVDGRWVNIEVKLARLNIANKTKGQIQPNWAFNNILRTPSKATKCYDILFAVGVNVLGFENPNYWEHFRKIVFDLSVASPGPSDKVLPHEPAFLNICGAFILPFKNIPTNHFRVTVRALSASPFFKYFSLLSDQARCKKIWRSALASATPEERA